jgi:hypothetical protein
MQKGRGAVRGFFWYPGAISNGGGRLPGRLPKVFYEHNYQRLHQAPPQLPPHRLLPGATSLRITRSMTAPIAALTIAETIPEPRWIPSCGNAQLAIKAPAIPTMRSPMSPKPVPCTTWPASQPAMRPTTNITRRFSPDMFIFAPSTIGPSGGGATRGFQHSPERGRILCKIAQMSFDGAACCSLMYWPLWRKNLCNFAQRQPTITDRFL